MAFKLLWNAAAQDDLKRLGPASAKRIIDKVAGHLVKDPINLATPLKGNLAGLHKYRIGDYRAIIAINLADQDIRILRIGHRKDVYK